MKECCIVRGRTRQRKEGQEPEEARDGNSKDVQKQDSTRKAVEALSVLLRVLSWTFLNLASSKIPQHQSTPAHPHDAVRLALVAGAEEQT